MPSSLFLFFKSCFPFQEKENFDHIGNSLFKFSFTDNLWTKNVLPILNNIKVVPDGGAHWRLLIFSVLCSLSFYPFLLYFDYLSAFTLVM